MKYESTAITHCHLLDNGDFDLGSTLCFDVDSTYPATDEQCDLLFEKMHKAGYEWDAEKKELKKISQEYPLTPDKPAVFSEQKTAWSEEDEDAIGMAIIALEDMYDPNAPNDTYAGYTMPFNKAALRLRALKDRVLPKNEWGENDERMLKQTIALIETLEDYNKTPNGFGDVKFWLKSLKDRVQSKQEWSEEDEKMIRGLITICDEWATSHSFYPIENCYMEKLKNWLNFLKERYGWKPSEEQMDALYTYIYNPQYFSSPDPRMELVESVYQDLKKLKG